MQNLYIVATGQHVGKTTVSLGLIHVLTKRGLKVHFFKPVGQEYVEKDGIKIDKDAVLVQSALLPKGSLAEISPVTVPKGFVEDYIFHRNVEPLKKCILEAYARLCPDCDLIVIEGTGHAGVGSCFDLSNADVAALLRARVILVVEGGIGSALDEVALSMGLFRENSVDVAGIIVNKVWPEKIDRIHKSVGQGLANMGLKLLGVMPYDPTLTFPEVDQVAKAVSAKVLSGEALLNTHIENVLIAAMAPQNVLPRIKPNSLMITPGDRIDNILLALNCGTPRGVTNASIVAIILTGGLLPDPVIQTLMKDSGMPVLLCEEDTYAVSSKVQRTVFKMLPNEVFKIQRAERLVEDNVDIEEILRQVSGDSST